MSADRAVFTAETGGIVTVKSAIARCPVATVSVMGASWPASRKAAEDSVLQVHLARTGPHSGSVQREAKCCATTPNSVLSEK